VSDERIVVSARGWPGRHRLFCCLGGTIFCCGKKGSSIYRTQRRDLRTIIPDPLANGRIIASSSIPEVASLRLVDRVGIFGRVRGHVGTLDPGAGKTREHRRNASRV
jgi:hypothetical protein